MTVTAETKDPEAPASPLFAIATLIAGNGSQGPLAPLSVLRQTSGAGGTLRDHLCHL